MLNTTTTTAPIRTEKRSMLSTREEGEEIEMVPKESGAYEHLTSVDIVYQQPIDSRLSAESAASYAPYVNGFDHYKELHKESLKNPEKFFGEHARRDLDWMRPFDSVYIPGDDGLPSFETNNWFVNGQLNACYNMVDRHAIKDPNRVALIYEGDEPNTGYQMTYRELMASVCQVAQVLKYSMGVKKGDTVAVYMPMIPQAIVTILAISRIGAIHSVVFAGFSSNSLRDRINDANSQVVITSDESKRGGKIIETKRIVDDAIKETPNVRHVLVYKRTNSASVSYVAGRDLDWDTEIQKYKPYYPCEPVDSEHPLFLLYTSGSTGSPKGVQHATAGYLLQVLLTTKYTFDAHPGDIIFTAGDIGWITGHSYVVYGPLLLGYTTVVFEGTPAYPSFSRYWDIIDKHKITHFYVAPTALRLLKRAGDEYVEGYSLKSLRALGSVGEPIAAEVWEWYSSVIGKNEIPICDTYWQTESGAHLLTSLAGGATPMKPGSAAFPFFGIDAVILNPHTGEELTGTNEQGILAIRRPWPSFTRTIWNQHNRYLDTYLKPYPGYYFSGDSATKDKDGFIWILGRVDDVVNVSGHRLSTAEVEAALLEESMVAECAVVGFSDELTGQAIAAFVVLKQKSSWSTASERELQDIKRHLILTVRKDIGPFAAPKLIILADDLPKTRSGKIMRRILRKILAGEADHLGDVSTLSNPGIVKHLIDSIRI